MLEHWTLVEIDFSAVYGVELEDEFLRRSFRWFAVKVIGLFGARHSLLRLALRPDSDKPEEGR